MAPLPLDVFCLEGDWYPDLRQGTSIRPLLELMEREPTVDVRAVHRSVGTPEELDHYLGVWQQRRYASYRLGWLAFHGSPGTLHIGRRRLTVAQLADHMGPGSCAEKIVYFGGCWIFSDSQRELTEFRKYVGAHTVCGYTEDVNWMEAAAFELLLLYTLASKRQLAGAFKYLTSNYGQLIRRLGFRSDPSWKAARRRTRSTGPV